MAKGMKIGVLSDTHGGGRSFLALLPFVETSDLVVHAGDILYHGPRNPLPEGYDPKGLANSLNGLKVPVVYSRGNCDADVDQLLLRCPIQAPYALLFVDGLQILVLHELKGEELPYRVDIVIFGHTHRWEMFSKDGILYLNPGSPSLPKACEASFAFIDTSQRVASVLNLRGDIMATQKF